MSTWDGIPYARPVGIRFHVAGSDEIAEKSYAAVLERDTTDGDRPRAGGPDDLHMGTTDSKYACETCHRSKQDCLGHIGRITLRYPVLNPITIENIVRWLKIVCHNCSRLLVSASHYKHMPIEKRFAAILAAASRVSSRTCSYCNTAQMTILRKSPTEKPTKIVGKDGGTKVTLYPHIIEGILSKITDADIIGVLGSTASHPRNFVLRHIIVPPVPTRPAVRKANGAKTTNDDITQLIQVIVSANASLPETIPQRITEDMSKYIYNLNSHVYGMIRGSATSGAARSQAVTLKGKFGEIRSFLLGKRVFNVARSTIVGDPSIPINGLGVPLHFARTIEIEEAVQPHNRVRLLGYVRNGKTKTYPAATAVIKASTGVRYAIEYMDISDIETGDRILRNAIDGDVALFNRQPTLTISNISAHTVIVLRDPHSYPIRMNVICTPLYNADFDGDAMNIVFLANESARVELRYLSMLNNWFMLYTTSGPAMGQVEDGVLGLAEITRDRTRFNRLHAMRVFSHVRSLPDFDKDEYSGRELISLALARTPVNISRTAKFYDKTKSAYVDYKPSETQVNIENGKLVSGVLDKSTIGKGAAGGLYHVLANEYNAEIALNCMHDMQSMVISYLEQRGYSVGILDVLPSRGAQAKIHAATSETLARARVLADNYVAGKIVASFGETQESMFEEQMKEALKPGDSMIDTIMRDIDPYTNGLYGMISTGSKGTPQQLYNMSGTIGQKLIDGRRTASKFGVARTSPYSRRFSTDPIDGGYIANSLVIGMNSHEFLAYAAASRFDFTIKALSTSVTGEQQRKSVKCLESLICDNHRRVVKDGGIIIEIVAGDNYGDARFLEIVSVPTVKMSNADVAKFASGGADDVSAVVLAAANTWASELIADRDIYRARFMRIERLHREDTMSDTVRCLFNIDRILLNTTRARDAGKPREPLTDVEISAAISYARNAIADLPYVYVHPIQRVLRRPIMPHHAAAAWLPQCILRTRLTPASIVKYRLDTIILEVIFNHVKLAIIHGMTTPGTLVGIIAAQSFSEPFTQYMLDAHQRSATGGSSFESVNAVRALLGAKATDNLTNPMMFIRLRTDIETDRALSTAVANNIETLKLETFIDRQQVFFESFGRPTHPSYVGEAAAIAEFVRLNPLLPPPIDLINYCVRLHVNKQMLMLKNMTIEFIIGRLRSLYPAAYFVYTPENAANVIIRTYLRAEAVKSISPTSVIAFMRTLLASSIRGIAGISAAKIIECPRTQIMPDGSTKVSKVFAIVTRGTNFTGVLRNPNIEPTLCMTDSVQEMAAIIGIVAARQQIVNILKDLIPGAGPINWSHFMIYADEMTSTGKVTPIEQQGTDQRDTDNIYLRMGFSAPLTKIIEAGLGATTAPIRGITPSLMIGTVPQVGTNYNKYVADAEFIRANVKSASAVLDSVFA